MPHDTSAKTAGDSSERASADKQIQISAAIASSLLVSDLHNLSNVILIIS